MSPIFAVEFWLLRAPGGVLKTPPGAPARAARAVAMQLTSIETRSLAHLESNTAISTAAPRGPALTRHTHRSSRRAAPGTALPKAAHLIQGVQLTPTLSPARTRASCEEATLGQQAPEDAEHD